MQQFSQHYCERSSFISLADVVEKMGIGVAQIMLQPVANLMAEEANDKLGTAVAIDVVRLAIQRGPRQRGSKRKRRWRCRSPECHRPAPPGSWPSEHPESRRRSIPVHKRHRYGSSRAAALSGIKDSVAGLAADQDGVFGSALGIGIGCVAPSKGVLETGTHATHGFDLGTAENGEAARGGDP